MKIELVEHIKPELKDPVMICGLPGSAFVGKFALDHLVTDLQAKALAELYCEGFPPQVMIKDDGVANLLRTEIYYSKSSDGNHDALFLTGDAQPSNSESEHVLSEYIIDLAKEKFSVSRLVTLGAYVTGTHSNEPRVFSTGTNREIVQKLENAGCILMREGGITGMNGLLLGMAKVKGIDGYSILGETAGFSFDPRASEIVLESLSRLTGITSDLKKLRQRGTDALETLKKIEQLSGEQSGESELPGGPRKRLDYIS
jgi:uncharacterized protein (TIGR00162 family)